MSSFMLFIYGSLGLPLFRFPSNRAYSALCVEFCRICYTSNLKDTKEEGNRPPKHWNGT